MEAEGISTHMFLDYHVQQMEQHRYLLTLDQDTVKSKFVRYRDGTLLAVPRAPERGVCVICDVREASMTGDARPFHHRVIVRLRFPDRFICMASGFWGMKNVIVDMIGIDKPNYFESMDQASVFC